MYDKIHYKKKNKRCKKIKNKKVLPSTEETENIFVLLSSLYGFLITWFSLFIEFLKVILVDTKNVYHFNTVWIFIYFVDHKIHVQIYRLSRWH